MVAISGTREKCKKFSWALKVGNAEDKTEDTVDEEEEEVVPVEAEGSREFGGGGEGEVRGEVRLPWALGALTLTLPMILCYC